MLTPHQQALKNGYVAIKGNFLLPPNYTKGHEHKWVALDAGYCVCQLCGWDHVCFKGNCPLVSMEHSEQICSISGCVILKTEMKPEWGIMERGNIETTDRRFDAEESKKIPASARPNRHHSNRNKKFMSRGDQSKKRRIMLAASAALLPANQKIMKGSMEVYEFVDLVVREILNSQKTLRCREEEMSRDKTRKIACLAKILREAFASMMTISYSTTTPPVRLTYQRPNMIDIEAKLSWLCRYLLFFFFLWSI
jgi:hypothetical protein